MLEFYCAAALLLGQSGADADRGEGRPGTCVEERSADQLARTLLRQHDALTAVSLIYTQVPRSPKGKPEGGYWRRAIAIDESGMFKSDNSHGHERLPWRLDPTRKSLVVTASEVTLFESLNRCVVDVGAGNTGTSEALNSIRREIFFDVLCWWPFNDWAPPQIHGHAYSMRALLNEGSYRLLPEEETIGSRRCFVFFVADILALWCDCDQPECVLKSERYDPITKAVDSRFEMRNYEEFGDSIWLPRQFRVVRFDAHAHTPRLRERVVYDNTFMVSDIKVNDDVDVSFFQQDSLPGTVRAIQSPGETRYEPVVDGQLDHFNSMLQWCRSGSVEAIAKENRQWGDRLFAFVLSFLVGCCVVAAISRAQFFK